ncbi:E3 ubiquitin-protein ligase FANCL isoform X7 [Carya illinoinensis]|uniref:E3 ubiquitin-protein ligase FANCL isoform X7 n=1 Tax=Carya illinoinensis TaxID=32201 RepID=UPI001C725D5D|nr:E3 ubiquitin-protein ligase FANCL isoform X7 [Carya illinoinensis]
MVFSQEHNEQTRCSELAKSSTFYRSLYSEIEEVGWELLVRLGGDLTFLSFRILDAKSRVHFVEIELDETYPKSPPRASAFQKEFWSTLDDIDKSLWVVDPKQPSRSMSHRQINIGNDCFIMLYIDADDPKSLPECRFMGPGPVVDSFRRIWQRNRRKWTKDRPYLENIACLLETQLPRPIDVQKNDQQVECGICYAQCLPVDDELGDNSGSGTDYRCDNTTCNKAFHSVCLGDWLRSITTTRQSFDVLFGNCPYCSEPVAVKITNSRK